MLNQPEPPLDYDRVLAVVHLLGGQWGSNNLSPDDPRILNAIQVVLEIERQFEIILAEQREAK